jgi:hypothetical protein
VNACIACPGQLRLQARLLRIFLGEILLRLGRLGWNDIIAHEGLPDGKNNHNDNDNNATAATTTKPNIIQTQFNTAIAKTQ